MTFNYDFNVATLLTLCTMAGGALFFWFRSANTAAEALRIGIEAKKRADDAHTAVQIAQAASQSALVTYQLSQAERLVSRDVLREVETRIGDTVRELKSDFAASVDHLGDRIDTLVKTIVESKNK